MKSVFQASVFFLKACFRSSPFHFCALIVISIAYGIAGYLQLFFFQQLLNVFNSGGEKIFYFVAFSAAWAATLAAPELLFPIFQINQTILAEKLTRYIHLLLIRNEHSIKSLDISDTPDYRDSLKTVIDGLSSRPTNGVVSFIYALRDMIVMVGILIFALPISILLPLVSIGGFLLMAWSLARFRGGIWTLVLGRTREARQLEYLVSMGLSPEYAAERKLYNLEPWAIRRYESAFSEAFRNANSKRKNLAVGLLIPIALTASVFFIVVAVTVWHLTSKSIGTIGALMQAMMQLYLVANGIADNLSMFWERILYFESVKKLIGWPNSKKYFVGQSPPDEIASIEFRNVCFSYTNGTEILKNVSFIAERGKSIAIVGENGAGKSTIVKLLLRLYEPTAGSIILNGKSNLASVDYLQWRSKLATVMQDFKKYSLTLLDNIILGSDSSPTNKPKTIAALADAGFSESFILKSLSGDAILGKEFGGPDLSGGEWQRVALARAFYRDADVLIFDEPNAALDPKQEAAIFSRIRELSKSKIAIIVTHRLAASRDSDFIIVVDQGELVEIGTHYELLEQNGHYASLWKLQAKSYSSQDSESSSELAPKNLTIKK